jgi:hypothetical protein
MVIITIITTITIKCMFKIYIISFLDRAPTLFYIESQLNILICMYKQKFIKSCGLIGFIYWT